ncbi:diguanylate cyclase/phosphodiesterase (GGDEF & EAL domains) with PAS/PAC sensor(s) [hydrothermal vent metagenome]|uniref:Diguanylate cyclase/phosphodiesterase (GGDEF & EAL domains) with PAS/PAC sensor(S) n=1 Tax=hydrothermal vent metagenome TaxID=652676 RepID=A0A3B0SIR2_9ZZZZ
MKAMSEKKYVSDIECLNCISLGTEISELKRKLNDMEQYALHDTLTGLANRRQFIESLEHRIMRCQRYGDTTALLFLDVNNLKAVNDECGHSAGDALLIRLSEILSANIRGSDMVARIGGDEFAILLDNLDADKVDNKIDLLLKRIDSSHIEHDGRKIPLGVAIGYCFVGPIDTIPDLMSRADAAMYKAKKGTL